MRAWRFGHDISGEEQTIGFQGEMPDLVAVSYYDQKPVHFLSTICESI